MKNLKSGERDKVLFSVFTANYKPDPWFIDSGATSHMTADAAAVENLRNAERKQVIAADGKNMNIVGMGDIKKQLIDGSQ